MIILKIILWITISLYIYHKSKFICELYNGSLEISYMPLCICFLLGLFFYIFSILFINTIVHLLVYPGVIIKAIKDFFTII